MNRRSLIRGALAGAGGLAVPITVDAAPEPPRSPVDRVAAALAELKAAIKVAYPGARLTTVDSEDGSEPLLVCVIAYQDRLPS